MIITAPRSEVKSKYQEEAAKRATHPLPAISQPAHDNTFAESYSGVRPLRCCLSHAPASDPIAGTSTGGIRKTAGRVCGSTGADSPPDRIKMFCLSATYTAMVEITGEAAKRAAHALPAVSQPAHDNTAGTGVGLS